MGGNSFYLIKAQTTWVDSPDIAPVLAPQLGIKEDLDSLLTLLAFDLERAQSLTGQPGEVGLVSTADVAEHV